MMAGEIYKKPILFAVIATVVILIGTVVTMFYPMMTSEMHPKLENLKPYTALQLAGKDIYQREGCNNCHTQTVRPLKTEVMRYGEYSKAGEFAYDRPFLWGSKRTGPDLARIGEKYPDAWHYKHFENPRAFFPQSNMPAYGWLKENKLDGADVESHMKALDFPCNSADIAALGNKTELEALVAYMQVIGTSVKKAVTPVLVEAVMEEKNPLAGNPQALHDGEELYEHNCGGCHGKHGEGGIGPDLRKMAPDVTDARIFRVISGGTQGGMPPFGSSMEKNKIWSMVTYIRSLEAKK